MLKKSIDTYYKVRKHGIVKSFRLVISRLYIFWECKIPWPLKARFYYHLIKLILVPAFNKKRILGIWDFKALPWSVGDPLVFIEMLSILKIENQAGEIDICIVYDRKNPGGNRAKRFGRDFLTSDNAQDYMIEFLPLFSTCPYLGSIYQFSSRSEFHRFIKNNIERYSIFPPLGQHLSETYNYYGGAPNIKEIQDFHNANGYIPHLRIGDREQAWAQHFYINYLPESAIPVTLSLKGTLHTPERNANPQGWLAFIDKCKMDFPEVIFVVVGLREEVFDGLRKRSNVIIAKDFGTSIIEDLSLIRSSLLYMGTNSGVNTIAQFSVLPYLIFQYPVYTLHKYGLKSNENFCFATDVQRMFSTEVVVTPELLLTEFGKLYSRLKKDEWRSNVLTNARNKHSHPTAKVS